MIRNTLIIAVFTVQSLICLSAGAQDTTPQGKQLFISNRCDRCHTIGRGRFVGPDLFGVGNRYTKEQIVNWITDPQGVYQTLGKMPVNQGYPPMPPTNVDPGTANEIAGYLLSLNAPPENTESGVIKGTVINKTTGSAEKDIEILLTSYMGDNAQEQFRSRSADDGGFEFEGLAWDRSYAITINYEGAEYVTDKMVFEPYQDSISMDLPIYEPTTDENRIVLREAHMIVRVEDKAISVADIALIENTGGNIYVGSKTLEDGRKETLRFSLPDNAADLKIIHGLSNDSIVKTDTGFSDTASVLPGQRRVVYSYLVPDDGGNWEFNRVLNYGADKFMLLVSDDKAELDVIGLTKLENVTIENENYSRWSGENLAPGHVIELTVGSNAGSGKFLRALSLGIAIFVLASGFIYTIFNRKDAGSRRGVDHLESINTEKKDLIDEIVKLDKAYSNSEINKNDYRLIRSKIKQRLIRLEASIRSGS